MRYNKLSCNYYTRIFFFLYVYQNKIYKKDFRTLKSDFKRDKIVGRITMTILAIILNFQINYTNSCKKYMLYLCYIYVIFMLYLCYIYVIFMLYLCYIYVILMLYLY